MKSIVKNSMLNAFKSFSNLIFPLITFAYASRIIGAEGLGKVDFSKSYTAYFSILAMLGITNYATREAAKLRDNKDKLSLFAHEILFINLICVIISCILFGLSICFIDVLEKYKGLLTIFSATIILNAMGMEWLYSAEEDYGYITIRTFLFQILSFILMIIFVKEEDDIYPYAAIQVISAAGSNILNFMHSRKYIHIKLLKGYQYIKHIKPILKLFSMTLFVQIFTHLDTTMLGFLKNDNAVGLYSAAHKLSSVVSGIMIAFTAVLTPRIAYYYNHNKKEKVLDIVCTALNYLVMISIPASVGLFLLSPQIIFIFSGSGFVEAISTARIMALRVFLVPLNTFFIVHYSIPIGKENRTIAAVAVAAALNFTLNMTLIPVFSQNGAAISTVIAEIIELIVNIAFISKEINFFKVFRYVVQYVFATIGIIGLWRVFQIFLSGYVLMVAYIVFAVFFYFLILMGLKNRYITVVLDKVNENFAI